MPQKNQKKGDLREDRRHDFCVNFSGETCRIEAFSARIVAYAARIRSGRQQILPNVSELALNRGKNQANERVFFATETYQLKSNPSA